MMRRQWSAKTIGLGCLTLSLVVLVNGCGGGGTAPQSPKPLWETTVMVGQESAIIETPPQYGAKIEIAAGTFAESTEVRVQVFAPDAFKLPDGGVASSHYIRLGFSPNAFQESGRISVYASNQDATANQNKAKAVLLHLPDGGWVATSVDFEGNKDDFHAKIDSQVVELCNQNTRTTRVSPIAWIPFIIIILPSPVNNDELARPSVVFYKWTGQGWAGPARQPSDWSNKKVALVLHGLLSKIDQGFGQPIRVGDSVSDMARTLYLIDIYGSTEKFYDEIWGVEYNWAAPIAQNGRLLGQILAGVPGIDQVNILDIHAHSMGGLVARYAIEEGGSIPVFRLFTYGTPHLGAPELVIFNLILKVANTVVPTPGAKDLFEGSQFIRDLNTRGKSDANYILFGGYVPREEKRGLYKQISNASNIDNRGPNDGVVLLMSADPLSVDPSYAGIIRMNCGFYASGNNGTPLRLDHSEIKALDSDKLSAYVRAVIY